MGMVTMEIQGKRIRVRALPAPEPVTRETVLRAAKAGRLEQFLPSHYTIYYEQTWREKLKICKRVVADGCLDATFDNHYDNEPIFIKGGEITAAGRRELAEIDAAKWQNRLKKWALKTLGEVTTKALVYLVPIALAALAYWFAIQPQ